MVTKRDNRQPTTPDRAKIEQSASGRLEGRVLQYQFHFPLQQDQDHPHQGG